MTAFDPTHDSAGIVCPYCGTLARDAWELFRRGNNECEFECQECFGKSNARADVDVTYSAWPSVPPPAEGVA